MLAGSVRNWDTWVKILVSPAYLSHRFHYTMSKMVTKHVAAIGSGGSIYDPFELRSFGSIPVIQNS